MRFKISLTIGLMCIIGLNAKANDQVTICEGDGAGGHVTLEYHSWGPGQYEASVMTYGSRNVIENPVATVNHLSGLVTFTGLKGIKFIKNEADNEFSVTIPAFGDNMKTTDGKCRLKGMDGKFRFEVSTLNGVPFVFSSTGPSTAFIHLYDAATGEQLKCNVDIDIQRFEVIDENANSIFSLKPDCRTNLGGVLSAYFKVTQAGKFILKAVSSTKDFEDAFQDIVVN